VIYHFSPDDELSQGDIIRRVRVMIDVSKSETSLPDYRESNSRTAHKIGGST